MKPLIPAEWLNGRPVRIINHWTAGLWTPSETDKDHYHILIAKDGSLVRGLHAIADNDSTGDNDYAAHTGELNTGSIGVAVCAMFGAVQQPFNAGKYPVTQAQWETLIQVNAELCEHYSIEVTPRTVLMHSEVKATFGTKGNGGKWDISVLPFIAPFQTPAQVYHRLRQGVLDALK